MRSPSMMVGFIEPVGTVIQSAHAERNINMRKEKEKGGAVFTPETLRRE